VKPPRLNAFFIIVGFASSRLHRLTRHANCKVQRISPRKFQHSYATAKGISGAPNLGWEGVRAGDIRFARRIELRCLHRSDGGIDPEGFSNRQTTLSARGY
jgi:hypothetical protein